MADQLANHLRRKLASYEGAGLTDAAAAVKAKLADVEAASPPAEQADSGEDLHSLLKADLVERAEAAGIDTAGLTKAELVDAIEAQEASDGD